MRSVVVVGTGGYVPRNGNDLLTSTVRTRHSENGIESQTGSDVTAVKSEGGMQQLSTRSVDGLGEDSFVKWKVGSFDLD